MAADDLLQIHNLKSRYFRYVDTKSWEQLKTLYDADSVHDSRGVLRRGPEEIAGFAARNLSAEVVTVHHGHMPEIELQGDTAKGTWAMEDIISTPDGKGFHGYGHYFDEYRRRANGEWCITSTRLVRLHIIPFEKGMPGFHPMPPELAGRT